MIHPVSIHAECLLYELRSIRMALKEHDNTLEGQAPSVTWALAQVETLIGRIEDVTTSF